MGVSMLPRLADKVMKITAKQIWSCASAISKIKIPRGTKMMSATSFVMSILEKKHKHTNNIRRPVNEWILFVKYSPRLWKKPISFSPAETSIKEKSNIRVWKSMYLIYSWSGFWNSMEAKAKTTAIVNTGSCNRKESLFFIFLNFHFVFRFVKLKIHFIVLYVFRNFNNYLLTI